MSNRIIHPLKAKGEASRRLRLQGIAGRTMTFDACQPALVFVCRCRRIHKTRVKVAIVVRATVSIGHPCR